MGWFFKTKKQKERAIRLMHDNTSVIGEQRHTNNRYIINKYQNSKFPLDILAVAVSFEREGASFRTKAIEYYEKFLSNPVEIPIIPYRYYEKGKPVRCISYWEIYSSLADLYEKEHNYDMAIKYLKKLPKESNYNNFADYTRLGNLLKRIDINQCINYYQNLMNEVVNISFKEKISFHVEDALCERKIRQEYDWVTQNLSSIAPKSLAGFRRMKNSNSKNFQKIVNKALEKGYEITTK